MALEPMARWAAESVQADATLAPWVAFWSRGMSAPKPSTDLEALLAHAGWVSRLARSLVVDPNLADDVVQQSWVAALDHPPRHGSNLRAWWAQVVRNTARQLGRKESRLALREKVAPRPKPPRSPADLAYQAELHQVLVGAVLALEEPYRSAILLRYYHDHSPQQIAEIHGVPGSTVRSWLRRGIEQLRARLDERVEGGRSAWTLVLAPLSLPRSAPVPVPVSAISTSTVGILAMALQTKLVLGAVLIGIVASVWVLSRPAPKAASEQQTAAAPAADNATNAPEVEIATVEPAVGSERQEASLEVASPDVELPACIGMVRDPEGKPVEGVLLSVYEDGKAEQSPTPLAEGISDADGRFRIEVPPPAVQRVALRPRARGYVSRTRNSIELDREHEVQLQWATDLFGTVTDAESGDPIADATVSSGDQKALAGGDGDYSIQGLAVGQSLQLKAMADGFAIHEQAIVLPRQDQTRFDIALQRGYPLVVELFDGATKQPIAAATIGHFSDCLAQADERGRAELRVVKGTSLDLRVDAEGYCTFVWSWDNVEELDHALRIPMLGVAWIEGTVQRLTGEASTISVRAENESLSADRRELTAEELRSNELPGSAWYQTSGFRHGNVPEDGRFVLKVIPCSEPYSVVARAKGYGRATSGPVLLDAPGARASVSIDMAAGAVVHGRVLINGQPWIQGRVFAFDASGGRIDQTWTDEQGHYEFPALPAGELHLSARTSSGSVLGTEAVLVAEPGKTYEHDIVVEVELATISGRVTNPDGSPAPGKMLLAFRDAPDGMYTTYARWQADGSYVLQVPPSLDYDLLFMSGPFMQRRACVAAGSKDIDFELPAIGRLRIRLVDAASKEPIRAIEASSWKLAWRRSGEDAFQDENGVPDVEGLLELELPVGKVDLKIALGAEGYAPRSVFGIEVEEGAGEPVTVELVHGLSATLHFESDPPIRREQTSGHLIFLLEESELTSLRGPFPSQGGPSNMRINGVNMWLGDPNLMQRLIHPGIHDEIRVPGLAPGRYWLRAYPDDFTFEPEGFLVDREDVEVTVDWRQR
jgi:RNA polymerase sigma-70 factor (ECF subfamily)